MRAQVPEVSVAGGRSRSPHNKGLPAAVQGALPVFNQSREACERPTASILVPDNSSRSSREPLPAVPDRTGLNATHGTARSVAIAMPVIVAMVVVFMVVGVMVMMVMAAVGVPFVLVPFVALAFALAPDLHDVDWAGR